MRFTETELDGAWVVDLEPREDERGFFARTFDAKLFAERGMEPFAAQGNMSYNRKAGTLRGMHWQNAPAYESKFIRCVRGAIYDVVIDLRPESPSYLKHIGVELTADNRRALYIPPLFAHGFITLEDDTDVTYQVGGFYTPGTEGGLRYDDPTFNIEWPRAVTVISEKDAAWPDFEPAPAASGVGR
jgi:dTDP-4-dehydrorhamnose 3,5-epimerase